VLQLACERAAQRSLGMELEAGQAPVKDCERPDIQAAFCLDLRSERIRRALETGTLDIETLGFAGFPGLPAEPCAAANERGPHETRLQHDGATGSGYRTAPAFGDLWKLAKTALGAPGREDDCQHGAHHGLCASLSERIRMAKGILRSMSLTRGFARIVVFAGHGSTKPGDSFAAAPACCLCGGHINHINARLAAELLNDRFVRAGLLEHEIDIPADTVFIAALHDPTTDYVSLLATESVTENHRALFEALQAGIQAAAERLRSERAATRGVTSTSRRAAAHGCCALIERATVRSHTFIAAPRNRTRNLTPDGQRLLHEYRHEQDRNYSVLYSILTGPLLAAGWRALEFYGASVDDRHFSSSESDWHNLLPGSVTGRQAGFGLNRGAPGNSLNDDRRFPQEPLRLTAVVEAPQCAIDAIIKQHLNLELLVENGWIQMHALDAQGRLWRRRGSRDWARIETGCGAGHKQSKAA
jgi:uncharacterized protein YbcC (UPF0753/DUF2309 family)